QVVTNERKEVQVGGQLFGVAPVAQKRLIDPVAGLAQIHRLGASVEARELLAPRALVPDAFAVGEGIAGADRSDSSGGRGAGYLAAAPESATVGAQGSPSSPRILDAERWQAHPSQLRVVATQRGLGDFLACSDDGEECAREALDYDVAQAHQQDEEHPTSQDSEGLGGARRGGEVTH